MSFLIRLFILFLFMISVSFAQEIDYTYYNERVRITVPPYGLSKVQKLIKDVAFKPFEYGDAGISALTAQQYKGLSFPEKFTYTMIYPEVYSQNCDVYIPYKDEEKKIFAQLPSWGNENYWSDRQLDFLREERDSVMVLIKESTLRSKKMGVNYKDAIVEINGWEMIPFIMKYFKSNPKDKDALTVLFLLMKKGEYLEFMKSSSYLKLYGNEKNHYEGWIDYNSANEALIFERAMGYYKEKNDRNKGK